MYRLATSSDKEEMTQTYECIIQKVEDKEIRESCRRILRGVGEER